jgi:hypothetical protein
VGVGSTDAPDVDLQRPALKQEEWEELEENG